MDRRRRRVSQQSKNAKHAQWLKLDRRKELGSIADRYPSIKAIEMKLSFLDPNDILKDKEHRRLTPESSAVVEVNCNSHECVGGGFDLTSEIKRIVEESRAEASGSKVCEGWQDRERIGKHRCHCHLDYRIECTYDLK